MRCFAETEAILGVFARSSGSGLVVLVGGISGDIARFPQCITLRLSAGLSRLPNGLRCTVACSDSQSITRVPPVALCCLAQFISRSRQA